MGDCRRLSTPPPTDLELASKSKDIFEDSNPYRQLVGVLMRLASTLEPDIYWQCTISHVLYINPRKVIEGK